MSDERLSDEAAEVLRLMLTISRRLFVSDMGDPTLQLPVAQLRVCALLAEGPMTMSCLSRQLNVTSSAATQMTDRLERSGLVERYQEGADRRIRSVRLTEKGEAAMSHRDRQRLARALEAIGSLSEGARRQVIAALSEFVRATAAMEDTRPCGPADEEALARD